MALTPTANQLAILQLNQAMLGQAAGTTVMAAGLPTFTTANAYAKVLFDANSAWSTLDATQAYTKLLTNLTAGTAATAADINALVAAVVAETGSTKLLKTIPEGLALLTVAFYNFATSTTTNVWTDAAKKLVNQVAVDSYYTLDKGQAAASTAVPAYVTSDPTTVVWAEASLDQGKIPSGGGAYTLTGNADTAPTFTGTPFADTYTATAATLTPGDNFDAGTGIDTMNLSTTNGMNAGAFFIQNLELLNITGDVAGQSIIDMSGVSGLTDTTIKNSSQLTTLNYNTAIYNLILQNLTVGAGVQLQYQDSVLAGTTTHSQNITLDSVNIANTTTGIIRVGGTTDTNGGVETVNLAVSGTTANIDQLDTDLTTLNISGTPNLTIGTALNNTVKTVNATNMSGNLNLLLNAAGTGNVTYTGSTGVDTVTFGGGNNNIDTRDGADVITVTGAGNDTVILGTGNDILHLGAGDDNINLGDGDDAMDMNATELTIGDTITGGAGNDTLTLNNADRITASEAENVKDIEIITMTTTGTHLEVHNNMVTSITGSAAKLTVNMGVAGNTVDISPVTFTNTNLLQINGTTGGDTVIADDAVLNAKASIVFNAAGGDVLQILDGATVTADDQVGITGLDTINLVAKSSEAQTWKYEIREASIGDGTADVLTIHVDRDVQTGSKLYITTAGRGASTVTVQSNANTTVYVDGVAVAIGAAAVSGVTVVSSLEFTENQDNLIGTGVFTGNSLDQFDTADNVNATGAGANDDTLKITFPVNNIAVDLSALLNNFAETADATQLEVFTFDTNSTVSFKNITGAGNNTLDSITTVNFGNGNNTVVSFANAAFATANFGTGNDTVTASINAGTYNMNAGNNSYTTAAAVLEDVNTLGGDDTFIFGDDGDQIVTGVAATEDNWSAGAGTDTLRYQDRTANGITVAAGNIAELMVNTGELEAVTVKSGTLASVVSFNNADAADFVSNTVVASAEIAQTGGIAFNGSALTTGILKATGSTGNDILLGGTLNDSLSGGAGTDLIYGAVGADTLYGGTAAAADAVVDFFGYGNAGEGAFTGQGTNYDVIKDFKTGTDLITVSNLGTVGSLAAVLDADGGGTGAGFVGKTFTDNNALNIGAATELAVYTTANNGGLTDVDLTTTGFANLLIHLNNVVAIAAAGNNTLFAVQGVNNTGIYFYQENTGDNIVDVNEIRLLSVVENQLLVGTDFKATTTTATAAMNELMLGTSGADTLTGNTGADTIYGFMGNDIITGGVGLDVMYGGEGANTFVFANTSTGLPAAATFDTIADYRAGVANVIDFGATALVIGDQGTPAAATVATISATGIATFNAADTTFAQHLTAVANAIVTGGATVAGESVIWQEGADAYLFISDATNGVSATDVLIKLVGVTVAAGGLTIAGGDITAIA